MVVYPFAVSAADVSLNSGIFQVAYRNMTDENQSAQQLDIAARRRKTSASSIATNLTQKGITTTCLQRGVPPTGNNVLILDGQLTDINEGNRLRRMVIGLGAGQSTLDSVVQVIQKTDGGSSEIIDFSTHAELSAAICRVLASLDRQVPLRAEQPPDCVAGRESRGGRRQELHLLDRLPRRQDDRPGRPNADQLLQPARMVVLRPIDYDTCKKLGAIRRS